MRKYNLGPSTTDSINVILTDPMTCRLPFVNRNYNAAMGVAIRTYLEMDSDEHRDLDRFASLYFPKAVSIREDVEVFCGFFKALVTGIKTLDQQVTKDVWVKAQEYLESRTQ